MPHSNSSDPCTLFKEKVRPVGTVGTNGEATEEETEKRKYFLKISGNTKKMQLLMLFTVELQKVLLLPIMHSRKEAFCIKTCVI
jgi:hypothetical protein